MEGGRVLLFLWKACGEWKKNLHPASFKITRQCQKAQQINRDKEGKK